MVALAGAAAEEIMLGDCSTGAKNDFSQAWQVAKEIVDSGLSSLEIIDLSSLPKEGCIKNAGILLPLWSSG